MLSAVAYGTRLNNGHNIDRSSEVMKCPNMTMIPTGRLQHGPVARCLFQFTNAPVGPCSIKVSLGTVHLRRPWACGLRRRRGPEPESHPQVMKYLPLRRAPWLLVGLWNLFWSRASHPSSSSVLRHWPTLD